MEDIFLCFFGSGLDGAEGLLHGLGAIVRPQNWVYKCNNLQNLRTVQLLPPPGDVK